VNLKAINVQTCSGETVKCVYIYIYIYIYICLCVRNSFGIVILATIREWKFYFEVSKQVFSFRMIFSFPEAMYVPSGADIRNFPLLLVFSAADSDYKCNFNGALTCLLT
jgi:hypothetical protein